MSLVDVESIQNDTEEINRVVKEMKHEDSKYRRFLDLSFFGFLAVLLVSLSVMYALVANLDPDPALNYPEPVVAPLKAVICPQNEPLQYRIQADYNNTPNVVRFYRTIVDVDRGRTVAWIPSRLSPVSIQLMPRTFDLTSTLPLSFAMRGTDVFMRPFTWYEGEFELVTASVSAADGGDVGVYVVPFTVKCK